MILFQIFFSLFIVFVLIKTVGRWRAKEINIGWLVFWLFFWLVAEAVVVSPDLSTQFAHFVGIGRGADLITYLSLALLFFFFFRLFAQSERQKKEITKLTRKISLMEKNVENVKFPISNVK